MPQTQLGNGYGLIHRDALKQKQVSRLISTTKELLREFCDRYEIDDKSDFVLLLLDGDVRPLGQIKVDRKRLGLWLAFAGEVKELTVKTALLAHKEQAHMVNVGQ